MKKNAIYDFMSSVIADLEEQERYSTARVYRCALNSVLTFGGYDLYLESLTPVWLHKYQSALRRQQLLWNTISTYMRMIRAVYNRAVDAGLVPYIPRQFKGVFTGRELNHQRVMERDEVRRVLTEDTVSEKEANPEEKQEVSSSRHNLRWARACLELMLRFHGMPFVDLAHLRKSDLRNGYLVIRRHKTGRPLSVAVSPAAMRLLYEYGSKDPSSPYLLDILDGSLSGIDTYKNYQRQLRLLNLRLKQLSCSCGLRHRLSSYTARHTWATFAKYCGIPVEVISEALGHASITTTEGYLKQFDNKIIEKANKVIMNYIFKG